MSKLSRRRFLAVAGLGGAGAAVGAVAAAQPAPAVATGNAPDGQKQKGYQVTEHIRKYYRTARV
ncbi:MAG TPA: twin-arginine translocation signal domain-containing protein [Burkholderiales bacterium]|nr:twin-arginine translocation signal domain-containing protein [Burkholderiales bacterium]